MVEKKGPSSQTVAILKHKARHQKGLSGAIDSQTVTYDLARLLPGSTEVSCSGFGQAIVDHMRQAVMA